MPKFIYGLRSDPQDLRDHRFRSLSFARAEHIPAEFTDLWEIDKKLPIFDQGRLGSCTANAIAAMKQLLDYMATGSYTLLSRLFLYWEERYLEGTVNEDSGAIIRNGFKVLSTIGCAPEPDFSYIISMFTQTPSAQAVADAAQHKIGPFVRVTNFTEFKAAVAEKRPVVTGMQVYSSFESDEVARTGIVPMPAVGEENFGGHATLLVGYKIINGIAYAIGRNSWSDAWGDKGYFYLPETFFDQYVTDMWTVAPVAA